jgi:DNA-binding NarL/FixJ family response regulator
MEMPVMDGINTVYYLSKVYPAIKVFGHTSSNDEKSKSEMLKSGALAVFSKNEKGEILKRIESLLGPCSFVSFQ